MFGSCMAIIVLAVLYEGLRLLRINLSVDEKKCSSCSVIPATSATSEKGCHVAEAQGVEETSR